MIKPNRQEKTWNTTEAIFFVFLFANHGKTSLFSFVMDPCVLGFEQDSGSKADDDHQDPRQCAGITHVEVRKRRAVEMRWKQGCCQQCCWR